MILAVVLSALVLLGWTCAANKYLPDREPARARRSRTASRSPLPQPQAQPVAGDARRRSQSRAAVLAATPRVRIETPSLRGSINLKGAQIDDLVLVRQRETIAKNSPPVRLLSPLGAPGAYFAQFGWTGEGGAGAGPRHGLDGRQRRPGAGPAGHAERRKRRTACAIRSRSSVDDGYLFTVQQSVVNALGASRSSVRPIGLVSRATQVGRPRQLDEPCRADRRVRRQGRLRRQLEGPRREARPRRSTTAAAGSASPTNIG